MKVDSYSLSAGVNHVFHDPAKFFMLIETGGPVTVRFRRNGSRTREVGTNVEAGYVSKPGNWTDREDRFDAFELESATNQTVRVGVSDREGDYRRALSAVSVEQADEVKESADVAVSSVAVQVVASNSNRKRVILQNIGAGDVRIGSSTVTNAKGIRLTAGGSITLTHKGAVYAIREDATDSTIAVLEEQTS